ncbi:hypothetical protein EIP86_009242 [Pleurotus ostreatoroseus]|nr:hypothetical protein EIP86_009242 [Pleurotus ostreatoroseus]
MRAAYDEDVYGASSSRFLSQSSKSASRSVPATNGRRPAGTGRGSSLAEALEDDSANGRHSLAHELAVALMPEPSAGSKLLAEEFGIEYDEGAEGIDDAGHEEVQGVPDTQELTAESFGVPETQPEPSFAAADVTHSFDPAFEAPTTPQRRTKFPEQDPMITLAQDLESTDKFISQLRRLDADQSGQPNLERLASDMIRRIDDSAREREDQVRELLEYEREFRRIGGEIGGTEVLGQLDELEDIIGSPRPERDDAPQRERSRTLDSIQEESMSSSQTLAGTGDWEADLDRDRERLAEDEEEYEVYSPSPLKASFTVPPLPNGPPTPATAIIQLTHFRTYTSTVASTLATISEQTQVNSAATTEAGRKIRALKNKLGGWRTEWDSAERSREKIEKWEAGLPDVAEGTVVVNSGQSSPRYGRTRIDGRTLVKEHTAAFELAVKEANERTQAIMAAVR